MLIKQNIDIFKNLNENQYKFKKSIICMYENNVVSNLITLTEILNIP